MTKQFNVLLNEIGESSVFANLVDEATQQELIDYFYFRYLCDDDNKFIKFFQRNLKMYKNQYEQYLRVQNITFDPMVQRYLERKFEDKYSRSDNTTESGNRLNTNTYNTENTSTANNTSTNKNSNVFSDMPQANVSGYTGQDIDNIDMTYATTMTVDKNNDTNNSEGTSNTTFEGSNNIELSNTAQHNMDYDLTHKEIYSGRDDTPQNMLNAAREYIVNTNAFVWLVQQLDKCFMCDLRYGEEE